MNAGLSKVHFVNSTGVSLNDRFTSMTKTQQVPFGGVPTAIAVERPRPRFNQIPRTDSANRILVEQWDRLHALQQALAPKAAPVRPIRQRLEQARLASQMKRTLGKLGGGARRLPRSNSFSDIATMNADRVELMQQARFREHNSLMSARMRTGAMAEVSARIGSRGRSTSRGRNTSRTRSTSRGRQPSLTRTNSQTNLRRQPPTVPAVRTKPIAPNDARRRLIRNNVVNRLGPVPAAAVARGRSRSRSRVRGVAPAAAVSNVQATNNGGRARSRSRKRSGSRARAGSVNSRLGTNRTSELASTAAAGRVRGGRVTKRSVSRRRSGGVVANATTVGARNGRLLKRETPKRKGAGGKKVVPVKAAKKGSNKVAGAAATKAAAAAATAAGGRRGRSRSRRDNSRVRGRSASKNRTGSAKVKQQPKSREELDNELDQYMANTKSSLDREMDQYMNGIDSSRN
uniref:Chromatin target of PRMT1 protein C-terminal domain-containing protein n=1 Tax=Anopheles farauti TaxID=69004 RepID=A0A182Q680_9DIPT